MAMTAVDSKNMTLNEAANHLGISREELNRRIKAGEVQTVRGKVVISYELEVDLVEKKALGINADEEAGPSTFDLISSMLEIYDSASPSQQVLINALIEKSVYENNKYTPTRIPDIFHTYLDTPLKENKLPRKRTPDNKIISDLWESWEPWALRLKTERENEIIEPFEIPETLQPPHVTITLQGKEYLLDADLQVKLGKALDERRATMSVFRGEDEPTTQTATKVVNLAGWWYLLSSAEVHLLVEILENHMRDQNAGATPAE